VLPKVGIENVGAIVSSDPYATLESNARTQAVVDSAAFVAYGLGAFCEAARAAHAEDKQSESKWDVYEALEAMALVAGSACAVGNETGGGKLKALVVLTHKRGDVAVLTQLNQTFLCPEKELVERTWDVLCQTKGAEAAVRCLSALATHMEGVAREMTKNGSEYYILPRVWEARETQEAVEADEAQVEDEEMGGERQGDEQDEADEADRDDESAEAVGRLASVSASVGSSGSRKRKSGESVGSVESGESIGVPVDELDEAIAKAMESGRAGLAEDADEDTRIAFFLKGAERINGPGGLEEQIQAKVKAGGIRQLSLSSDAVSMELRELEEKQGNLRVAMQEATARVEARKVHSALVQMRMKRQRS
jgi:hypothetical protein